MQESQSLPRWDMDAVYPGIDSEAYRSGLATLTQKVSDLRDLFSQLDVREGGRAGVENLDVVLQAMNDVLDTVETHSTYVSCLVTTNTRDEAALSAESALDPHLATLRKLSKSLTGWLGGLDIDLAFKESETARAHRYAIQKAQVLARHLMTSDEEGLASDLELTGSVAWVKLYAAVSSQVEVSVEVDGESQLLPMSSVRAMSSEPRREVRRAAYEAELAAWKTVEVPLAAAMNGIKGETILLSNRRGWKSPLEAACFGANIDIPTLEAMMTAARESFPTFRRYMNAKARSLGLEKLAWFDVFAPLQGDGQSWEWDIATEFVADQFERYSKKMGDFARRSYAERWIDAGSRAGKVGGAYCAPLRADESRILMNFKPDFDSVRTLAHELGHAYHNICLNGRTAIQRETPMTLAETASIFCETIVKNAVLEHGTEEEKKTVLEASLQGACQVVVDITSRYDFETSVFELRADREIAPRELCELMRKAQLGTYGDGLDSEYLHPYMWAAKPHYYGSSFYNFPYMFGLLFGLGLYAIYRQEPDGFHERYDALLSRTGGDDAATLAAEFGIDIRTPEFWRASLNQIAEEVDRFEALV